MKNTQNAMKPGTRVMVHLVFLDGSIRGWGYDYPHYPTVEYLRQNIAEDFNVIPEHDKILLSYGDHDTTIDATDGDALANKVIDWLLSTGDFS